MIKSLLGFIDRLSTRSTLNGETGSLLGLLGTIGFLIIVISVYLITTIDYFNGIYFSSEFETWTVNPTYQFGSGRDFKAAVVFKNKVNHTIFNHSALLDVITS